MLVSPEGTGVMLMSDACGIDAPSAAQDVVIQPENAITVTFDDEAAEQLPADASQEQGCVSGTFRPVDDEDDNFAFLASDHFLPERTTQVSPVITNSESPDYPTPDTALLSAFDGQNPNGTWSLYVIDDWPTNPSATPAGAIEGGWSLEITTTGPPAPTTVAECKSDGWRKYGFANQGLCISSVTRPR